MSTFASGTVLNKYEIEYFRCPQCGLLQTEDPYWLAESYSDAIAATDVGLVMRNTYHSVVSRAVISALFNPRAKFLDYGGGYGMFVRLMRDAGFDFYWADKFCTNRFAKGFEVGQVKKEYELVTAWEVFEHLPDPCSEIKLMFDYSDAILFSTELIPPGDLKPGEWWYFAPEDGQHVTFYSKDTLLFIAQQFGAHLYTDGKALHLLTRRKVRPVLYRLVTNRHFASIVNCFTRRKSFLQEDYQKAVERSAVRNNSVTAASEKPD